MPDADKLSPNGAVPIELNAAGRSDTITYWAQAWADFFSSDAVVVEEEAHSLCDKIRSRLSTIEGKPPPA